MARLVVKLPRLRQAREGALLTQEELASKAGVHRVTVANIERGGPAEPATVRALAQALGLEPAVLLEEK